MAAKRKRVHFEAHIEFSKNLDLKMVSIILARIKQLLSDKFSIDHITLQPEFGSSGRKKI